MFDITLEPSEDRLRWIYYREQKYQTKVHRIGDRVMSCDRHGAVRKSIKMDLLQGSGDEMKMAGKAVEIAGDGAARLRGRSCHRGHFRERRRLARRGRGNIGTEPL